MGFFDKIKEVMNAPGDDDYEYEDDYEETNEDSDFMNYSSRSESTRSERNSSSKDNKVVNIHATTQLQVVLVKPEEFSEARQSATISTTSARWCSISNPPPRTSQGDLSTF